MQEGELVPPGVVGPHGTLLIGDLHGTREIPAFVGRLVATLVAREPVVLALEIRRDLAPSIDAFVASDGGPAARAAALRDRWWHDIHDGRGSVAMFELVDTVRRLRAGHADVRLELFDPGIPDEERAARRERLMADHLIAVRRADPAAILIVYAGNLHTIRRGVEFRPGHEWMAMRMARAGIAFVTLDVHYDTGTAWLCREAPVDDCGPEIVRGHHDERGIHLAPSSDGNYDGWCGVGPITASPPAGRPELALGLDARLTELLRAFHARYPRSPDQVLP
jgi:hypothetical protein